MLVWLGAAFIAVLYLLAVWQRGIDRRERSEAIEQLREAKALGADRPMSQHPQIAPLQCIGCSSCIRACPEGGVLALVDGIARVVQASRCVGHGVCADACPVGALTIGLGDLSDRADIPILTDELESTVPGVFIAGELGGLALIRNAIEQGQRTIVAIAGRPGRVPPGGVDVLIVGAGPAGLSASLKAKELGLSSITIDQGTIGGTLCKYPRRKLVLTQPVQLPMGERFKRTEYRKEELIEQWRAIIERHDLHIRESVRFLGIHGRTESGFEARTSDGPVSCRFVVLALGRRGTPRTLGVPGEERESVLYQLVDAATFTHQRALVVGGGDTAIEGATALADQLGNVVRLAYRKSSFFRLKRRNAERIERYASEGRVEVLFSSEIAEIEPDRVRLRTGATTREFENDYTFVFAGGNPPFPLLRDIGVGFGGGDTQ